MEQSNYILCGDSSSVFIVVRTQYEIYPLNTLLSVQYSIVNYKHNVVQQNFRIYSLSNTLYLFCNSPFSSALCPDGGNHQSTLFL